MSHTSQPQKVKVSLTDILGAVADIGRGRRFYVPTDILARQLQQDTKVTLKAAREAIEGAVRFGALRRYSNGRTHGVGI